MDQQSRDISLLLQNCDIGDVLMSLGIDYESRRNKNGQELYFSCPTKNHPEEPDKKRASIAEVGQYKGFFNCWSCQFRGNLIHLIRHVKSVGFIEAINYLESRYGSSVVKGVEALKLKLTRIKPMKKAIEEIPTVQMPDDYVSIFSDSSEQAVKARDWLIKQRGITADCLRFFNVGLSYDDKLGLMVTIPVYFKERLVSVFRAQPFDGGAKRYPKNSPQGRILFNYDYCSQLRRYIMVESILDVIKIHSMTNGMPAMACFTNMISSNQLDLLKSFELHAVMPDQDNARGWLLVQRMVPVVGKSLNLLLVPIGKDPGDCNHIELISAIGNPITYARYEFEAQVNSHQAQRVTVVKKK